MSEGFESLESVTMDQFASAVKIASVRAREAVSNPKEGTILTVIKIGQLSLPLDNPRKRFQKDYFKNLSMFAQKLFQKFF